MAAEARLKIERKNWRKDHPVHFVAKPVLRSDGSTDLFNWDIKIPAREDSIWFPAMLSATMTFTTVSCPNHELFDCYVLRTRDTE